LPEDTPNQAQFLNDVSVQMAFACEGINTDPVGRVSFQSVTDQLNAPNFPATTPTFWVVFGFVRSLPGFLMQCKIEIVPPVGDPIVTQSVQDMAFTPKQVYARAIFGYQGVVWPIAGTYSIRFTSMGKTIASFPISVTQVPLPPGVQ
jgi:hypothetical protein